MKYKVPNLYIITVVLFKWREREKKKNIWRIISAYNFQVLASVYDDNEPPMKVYSEGGAYSVRLWVMVCIVALRSAIWKFSNEQFLRSYDLLFIYVYVSVAGVKSESVGICPFLLLLIHSVYRYQK